MKKIALFSFLFLLSLISAAQPTFVRDSLESYLQRTMQQWQVPGMAVCIVKDGKVVLMKGYGKRNEKGDPVDENTLFMIASNTKAFTATALATLEQEKRLTLDDKLTSYFPWFRMYDTLATRDVTIRDAITHRLGLQTFQGDMLNWGGNLSRKQVMEKMAVHKPVYPFRYHYGYCNAGFVAAGEVIPAVTDTSWDDFLKYRIFKPLGMNRTSTTSAAIRKDENACQAFTVVNDKIVKIDYANVDNLGAAASINSSVNDLSKWMLMLLDSGKVDGKQVIPYAAIRETRTPQTVVNQVGRGMPTNFSLYGLGWFLEDYNGRKLVRHDGGANGFVTSVCLVPSENLGIAVLTNTDVNWLYTILRHQILQAYLDVPYKDLNASYYPRYRANTDETNKQTADWYKQAGDYSKERPATSPEAFVGIYKNEVYDEISVKMKDNKLVMYFSHHPYLTGELSRLNDNEFVCRYSDPTYGIVKIPFEIVNGKVTGCRVTVNDFVDMMSYDFKKTR